MEVLEPLVKNTEGSSKSKAWPKNIEFELTLPHSKDSQCIFWGVINNREDLLYLAQQKDSCSDRELMISLLLNNDVSIVDKIKGDFSFIFFDSDKSNLAFFRSESSSFPIYYSDSSSKLKVSDRLNVWINQRGAECNIFRVLEKTFFGINTDRATLINNVDQLSPGEMICFSTNKLLKKVSEHSFISEKNWFKKYPSITCRIDWKPEVGSSSIENSFFNYIPKLARSLGLPTSYFIANKLYIAIKNHTNQISFNINEVVDEVHVLDYDDKLSLINPILKKKITKRELEGYLSDKKQRLINEFDQYGARYKSFNEWFTCRYYLPNFLSDIREMSADYSNTVVHEQIDCSQNELDEKPVFNIEDKPPFNVFEAMQRLFWHGVPGGVNDWFNLAPMLSAGVIKKRKLDPVFCESFAVSLLSVDYLIRMNQWVLVK
ncbi:hypothetical protein [Pleionea sediminis]|uniref:hypothetical protein n=1 Tax=Pleionea sediminis TaxID=2569479 RepID=UPI0011872B54|nr:hypothetical protein [Pleionea sediminis]